MAQEFISHGWQSACHLFCRPHLNLHCLNLQHEQILQSLNESGDQAIDSLVRYVCVGLLYASAVSDCALVSPVLVSRTQFGGSVVDD